MVRLSTLQEAKIMSKKYSFSLLAIVLIAAVFIGLAKNETDKSILATLPHHDNALRMEFNNSQRLDKLRVFQEENHDIPYFEQLTEQQLMEKSMVEAYDSVAQDINQQHLSVTQASVNFSSNEIIIDDVSYPFTQEKSESGGFDYALVDDNNGILTNENLNHLADQARPSYSERNDAIWGLVWPALAIFVPFTIIGLLLLFNLEAASNGFVNLFIKGSTAGPMVKFMLALSGLILIVVGFAMVYFAYDGFTRL